VSLLTEGPQRIGTSLTTLGTTRGAWALAGLAFTVLVATVLGSGIWTTLLSRHPSSTVAPFSMLVPVVGVGASWLAFGERVYLVELACGAVVVAGVLLSSSGRRTAVSPVAPPLVPATT
jgi:O-acetylserine/cysteine efflux transporter